MNHLPNEVQQLFDYLKACTSAFHVVEHSRQVLKRAGFQELSFKDAWNLEKGGRYFCVPFDTTLYAFTIGSECDLSNGIHIGGAHTDFPALKVKPNPEIFSHGYLQLNTEVYGGPILNTFFEEYHINIISTTIINHLFSLLYKFRGAVFHEAAEKVAE